MADRVTQKNFQKQLRIIAEAQRKQRAYQFSMFRKLYYSLIKKAD